MLERAENVLVLKGGTSAEREVSIATAAAVETALDELGYVWQSFDYTGDFQALQEAISKASVIFNALHGTIGEDGRIQAIGDLMRIPYTHSGVTASALAMNKQLACQVFAANGLPIAEHRVLNAAQIQEQLEWPISKPLVCKPVAEGSSFGVALIFQENFVDQQQSLIERAEAQALMFEEYIPGQELTVAVLEIDGVPKPLAVTELVVAEGFYDYQAKYSADQGAQHFCPANIPAALAEKLMQLACDAHRALGLRGVSRSDFRYDTEADRIVLLETNTQPGMTRTSLLPEQAGWVGVPFPELIDHLLRAAKHDG